MAKIGMIHPVPGSMHGMEAAFKALWPSAVRMSIFDESLYQERGQLKTPNAECDRRIAALLSYSESCGADAVYISGSFFGSCVDKARPSLKIPAIRSYDPLIAAALASGKKRIGILATDPDTPGMIEADMAAEVKRRGLDVALFPRHVSDAVRLMLAGDLAGHDRLVAEAAATLPNCDLVLLGQVSMGPGRPTIEQRTGLPVLTASETAVAELKRRFA